MKAKYLHMFLGKYLIILMKPIHKINLKTEQGNSYLQRKWKILYKEMMFVFYIGYVLQH